MSKLHSYKLDIKSTKKDESKSIMKETEKDKECFRRKLSGYLDEFATKAFLVLFS